MEPGLDGGASRAVPGSDPVPDPIEGREEDPIRIVVNVDGVAEGVAPDPEGGRGLSLGALVDVLEGGVRAALERGGVTEAEISLTLLDDDAIRDLNRRYLDRDRPTDVIAFPLYGPDELVVGDVYVGFDQGRRQAAELRVPLREELVRLAIHGTLHVLGHEHPEDGAREESEMFRIQEELVERVLGAAS